jgi:hypothetical protein
MSYCDCNVNFISQYAFVNDKQIHISDYDAEYEQFITCQNGHPLVPVINVTKRIPHFRHKNKNDVGGDPITLWHCEWQSFFPITEKSFPLKDGQIKQRRADVVLNQNKVLEIQHSKYEKQEIENRKHDYSLHNVEIIWLIDGNNGINVNNLEFQNRCFIEFVNHAYWKYESFQCYNCIYIDINSYIYKINPNKVKSHMIDVEKPKSREQFIKFLNDGIDIWNNEELEQCNLYIKQQGAGNGKTYGIIKMLEDADKSHYKNFIYITKQHSAKHIIKSTLEEIKNDPENKFRYLKDIQITENNKKYIIKYFNELSNQDTTIIIATIDSFTYSIGNKHHTFFDKFEGLINSIIDGYIESRKCGAINFANIQPRLNKETLLVIDEFQDPPEYYGKAIVQIMLNKYIDVYIVGDKLQSISNEKNAFTYFLENEFPSINIVKLEPTNICRRFTHPKLVGFVNFMIPFKKYKLPEIIPYKSNENIIDDCIVFIKGKSIVSNLKTDENDEIISREIQKIMLHYDHEVSQNNRFPEDFLIVTPFTKNNPLVEALLLSLNIFWKNKFTDDENHLIRWKNKLAELKNSNVNIAEKDIDNIERILSLSSEDYNKYAVFHKSEEGSSIDLSESDYATRIVSCHASKGDGRKVVFTIGFNESSIKKFSQICNNLVYDSLLHVAITRMKEKLYIYYIDNGDDISEKIKKYMFLNDINKKENEPFIDIKNKIKYSDLFCENKSTNYKELYEKIIQPCILKKLDENKDEKKIVDMGNHMIRYSSLYINLQIEIINREMTSNNKDIIKQLKAILHKVSDSDITEASNMKGYYAVMKVDKEIPIIKISDYGRDYKHYYNVILENIQNIQVKLKDFLNKNIKILLCPLECIILHYMMEIVTQKQYSSISIQDVYNIVDVYSCSFRENNSDEHKNCLCSKHFNNKKSVINTSKIDNMHLYLLNHFEKMNTIKSIIDMVYSKFPKINWLVNNISFYEGNHTFEIYNKCDFIGYNDTHVIISYIKPQFNQLNYNDVLLDSIYDTYFLHNIKKFDERKEENKNYKRFNGKKIITCIFSLDLNEPYYIDWVDEFGKNIIKENEGELLWLLYQGIMEKYKSEHGSIYKFYNYWREFCPEDERKPLNFIQFLKGKLSECETPLYVSDFFTKIGFKIEMVTGKNSKSQKEQILIYYDTKENFILELNKELEKRVKNYLNIRFDEDDEEDEEEDTK